jgi:hypothetical protein
MKYVCQYSLIRFMPFPETGEFANVGVVLHCPKLNLFKYKLTRQTKRVDSFFHRADLSILKMSLKWASLELEAIERLSADTVYKNVFNNLSERQGTLVHFSKPYTAMSEEPLELLSDKFDFYVNHSFATKEYAEQIMERELRILLKENLYKNISFKKQSLGVSPLKVTLPLVAEGNSGILGVIKPLFLGHDIADKAYDHFLHWHARIAELLNKNVIQPKQLLLATRGAKINTGEHAEVYNYAISRFHELDVNITESDDTDSILNFAKSVGNPLHI